MLELWHGEKTKDEIQLLPTAELTALCTQLKGFELYAKQYYLSKGKDEEESDVTPVEPETAGGKQAE